MSHTESRSSTASKRDIRTRDAERTRAELLATAVREFANHGFHGARVDRITKSAKCNSRMLYHYFGSKERLYLAVLDEVYANIRAQETQLNLDSDSPEIAMRRLVEFTFDYFSHNKIFLNLTRNENMLGGRFIRQSRMIRDMSQPLLSSIDRLLERGFETGVFRERGDPLQLYVSIVALSAHHLNNAATLSAVFGADLTDKDWQVARRAHVVSVILRFFGVDEA